MGEGWGYIYTVEQGPNTTTSFPPKPLDPPGIPGRQLNRAPRPLRLGAVVPGGTQVPALGPLELAAEDVDGPDEHAVGPAEALDDLVLAAAAGHVGRLVAVLFKHDAVVVVPEPVELGRLRGAAPRGVPRAKRRVEVSLSQVDSQAVDFLVGRVLGAKGGGRVGQALHEDVHQGRPHVGLVPLLPALEVGRGDAALAAGQVRGDAREDGLDGKGVAPEVRRRGALPEGVELADVEEDLLAGGRAARVGVDRGGVVVGKDVDVLAGRGEVEVEVAEEGVVPHDGVHGGAAVGGALLPGGGGRGVAAAVEEARDGELVAVQDRVEAHGHHVPRVHGPQRKVHLARRVLRVRDPARAKVPAVLGARRQVGVQVLVLGGVELARLRVDDARLGVVGRVARRLVVLAVRLWPRLRVVHGVAVQRVRLPAGRDLDGAVGHPEVVLLDQQGQRALQDAGVVGVVHVELHHLRQHGRLRAVQVVDARAVGHDAVLLDKVEEVLDGVLGNLGKGAARAQEALENPVRVPVVRLAETATGHDKGPLDGDEAVGAVGAGAGRRGVVGARQAGPDVDDLLGELLDDGVVDGGEELGVGLELRRGHLL